METTRKKLLILAVGMIIALASFQLSNIALASTLVTFNNPSGIQFTNTALDASTVGLNWNQSSAQVDNLYYAGVGMSADGTCVTVVANGGGIYKSINHGSTWSTADNQSRGYVSVVVSADGLYQTATADNDGVYVSINHGQTWSRTYLYAYAIGQVAMSSDGQYQTVVIPLEGIITSSNHGISWTQVDNNANQYTSVAMSANGKYQTVSAGADVGGHGGGIYVSSNYGASWTLMHSSLENNSYVTLSSDGEDQVAVLGGHRYESKDYGSTWGPIPDNTLIFGPIVMSSDGRYQTTLASHNNTNVVATSNDHGLNWIIADNSNYNSNSLAMSSNGQYQIVATSLSGLFVSSASLTNTWNFTQPWTKSNTIAMAWNPEDGSSNITRFLYAFNQNAADSSFSSYAHLSGSSTQVTSSTLADGAWYYHLISINQSDRILSVDNVGPINIDSVAPTATLSYSTASPTNPSVIVTITPSEPVTVTNNGGKSTYTFSSNGTFTFEFMDRAGNTGSSTATVTNIVSADSAKTYNFVKRMYTRLLERDADRDGITYWYNRLLAGQSTKLKIINAFTNTDEYYRNYVRGIYHEFMNRDADQSGLNYWTNAMLRGLSKTDLIANFAYSPEYLSQGNSAFVASLYQDFMNRTADPSGVNYWVAQLSGGAKTKQGMIRDFFYSYEFNAKYVQEQYQQILARGTDSSGEQYWVGQLQHDLDRMKLTSNLLDSDEFWNHQ